jgi:small GTP-binding protein
MPTVPSIPAPPSSAAYDPTLLLTVILSLLIPVLYIFRSSKKSSSRKLVIFGPVGGGKSAIYHRLRFGRVVPTVSSMTVTSATFVPNGLEGKPMHIVDVPGSGRLRAQLLEQVSDASALLCVLDGTQLSVQAREAAGVLFEVLSHEPVARRKLPVLVAVNKVDSPGAATPTAARKAIEQEVQRVRLARTTLSDTSGRDKKFSGIAEDDGRPFSFDHLETNTVVFAAISATKPELSAVHSLLKTLR